ncbi:hypothetical protein SAMN05421686_106118 [Thalassolituus maritimus]|uniref:Uncharacterized protein n=1 Tax=Thalassolituus maritimus TaxID=484498 RepID=A0A1N7N1H9_9GAMM|nr:hypothetical protein [Thalassolituus maritimus]SIS92210.1 hypothetical protein SAMN05421686_106118 [Thalassolituus maritimus]
MLNWLPEHIQKPVASIPTTGTPHSLVRRSADVLALLIRDALLAGDHESAFALAGVRDVLNGLSKPTDPLRRRAESDAYDFIADYTESQAEVGVRGQALADLKLVADVLAATDIARKQEAASGQLCSFARVEEIIGNLYAKSND